MLVSLAVGSCSVGLSRFGNYRTVTPRIAAEEVPLALHVTAEQRSFAFDSRISMNDVTTYVRGSIAAEMTAAGYSLVDEPVENGAVVEVVIKQIDMGYELFWWWMGWGYTASETVATVQLRVSVTDLATGMRHSRSFAGYKTTYAKKGWVYFIPIPIVLMDDESRMMLRVSQEVFGDVARGVDQVLRQRGGGG